MDNPKSKKDSVREVQNKEIWEKGQQVIDYGCFFKKK